MFSLLCLLAQGCTLLSWFEDTPERTPASRGRLVFTGHIDPPFTVAANWSYYTLADTRACRTGYSFAIEQWSPITKQYDSEPAQVDGDGNYRLVLDLTPPTEAPECQWVLGGVSLVARFREPSRHGSLLGDTTTDKNAFQSVDFVCTYSSRDDLFACDPSPKENYGGYGNPPIYVPFMRGETVERIVNIRTVSPSEFYPMDHMTETALPTGPRRDGG